MAKNLVIVESPAKAKTIEKFLGKDYSVLSSFGHVRDLSKKDLGVDLEKGFIPNYEISTDKKKIVKELKKNRHLGNMEWNGKNYQLGTLADIPNHVKLYKGDTIVTSGNSLLFPEGIAIGTVENYQSSNQEKFSNASIKYSIDFNKVFYVYIIVNLMEEELNSIEEN